MSGNPELMSQDAAKSYMLDIKSSIQNIGEPHGVHAHRYMECMRHMDVASRAALIIRILAIHSVCYMH